MGYGTCGAALMNDIKCYGNADYCFYGKIITKIKSETMQKSLVLNGKISYYSSVKGLVDDPGDRFDQRHEEQREPDDADEQHDDHAPHPIQLDRLRVVSVHTQSITALSSVRKGTRRNL
ncbi:hypothetical protein Celaphus_00017726 [Cervus elaphus hippelaphus]|uniref:Uncharacterized protein n=1 Tax=Cervus elaphus hippelaphus TaxID=46360 RepID=A0A212C749_CEREH|nr:hypothetical protein Celaphus_00017726 [Cervus elaphus hippelaphus]